MIDSSTSDRLSPEAPGAAPRHGRAYRELFQFVRAALTEEANDE